MISERKLLEGVLIRCERHDHLRRPSGWSHRVQQKPIHHFPELNLTLGPGFEVRDDEVR